MVVEDLHRLDADFAYDRYVVSWAAANSTHNIIEHDTEQNTISMLCSFLLRYCKWQANPETPFLRTGLSLGYIHIIEERSIENGERHTYRSSQQLSDVFQEQKTKNNGHARRAGSQQLFDTVEESVGKFLL